MAPEQHAGAICDAAADQFAFCVCAFELLFGVRPFKGRALMMLALAKEEGRIEAVPSSTPVPRGIREAILRGLAAAPDRRWPDLDTLLTELERGLARRGPWLLAGVVGIGALGLGLGLLLRPEPLAAPTPVDPCAQAIARADAQLGAVWTAERRERLSSLLSAPTLLAALDGWTESWRAASRSACDDVHNRRTRSEGSLDRRGVCLDRRLSELDGLGAAVEAGELLSEHDAVERLAGLEDPASCLGEAVLAGEFASPPAEERAAVAELRRELIAVNTGTRGESLGARIVAAEGLLSRAREIGWRPLIAEAALGLGHLRVLASDAVKAREPLGLALDIAGRSNDIELAAKAWSELNRIERTLSFDPVAAEWTWQRQSAVFTDFPASPRQRARLASDRGQVRDLQAERGKAEEALREALRLYEGVGPLAAWDQAATLRRLGTLIMDIGRAEEALELFARARALEMGAEGNAGDQTALLGASTMLDEALALFFAGSHDEALAELERALDRARVELGPRSELVARIHVTFVAIYAALERNDRLREHAEFADEISLAALGPAHPFRSDVLSAVGTAAQVEGRIEDARNAYVQSLAVVRRVKPEDSVEVAEAELNLALVLDELGEKRQAQGLVAHCLPILERDLEVGHPEIAMARALIE